MRAINSGITVDDDGLYSVGLTQVEIILLYAGVVPYIAFLEEPQIPDNELLFIHQIESELDKHPLLDPIPCQVLSIINMGTVHIMTVRPDEIDLEFEKVIDDLRSRLHKMPPLRTDGILGVEPLLN